MKRRMLLGIAGLFLSISLLLAQEVPSGVVVAFKKGDAQELGKYMGDKVNLVTHNQSVNVDKQGAIARMKSFFAANKVKDFTINHQGKRDESSFIVGTLVTANGNFRVHCFLKRTQNLYLIHQIRMDKSNE